MKKLNFDLVFKTIIMVYSLYLLFLLTLIAFNSGSGRYQNNVGERIIDTKTGKIYHYHENQMIDYEKLNEK